MPAEDFESKLLCINFSYAGFPAAKDFTMDLFNKFVVVGALAAVGYGIVVILMFVDSLRGIIFPHKWMSIINPFFFMVICIVLSKMLPQSAFINGVFNLGQQSLGLFIVFLVLFFTTD